MRSAARPLVVFASWLTLAGFASACMWDYDTLLMERRAFPGTIEMISGKFLRHSPEFYHWRIRDRTEKLKHDPSRLDWYDDLAVAYSKTGDHKKAIEIIEQKDRLKPGLYETEANWGTFLLFDGQWEAALQHVRRALEINPNAHFGREKYQALLIEYVLPRLKDGKPQLPLASVVLPTPVKDSSGKEAIDQRGERFDTFLQRKLEHQYNRKEAVTAVLGMMHFADYRTPLLLEPLATLLTYYPADQGERQLAARAYLRAASAVDEPHARDAYAARATDVLEMQVGVKMHQVEQDMEQELREADAWFAELREAEIGWIRDGKDPEAEFLKRYPVEPEVTIPILDQAKEFVRAQTVFDQLAWGLVIAAATILLLIVLLVRYFSRRSKAKNVAAL